MFGAAELTQSFDIHKYKYAGCGIGFDRRGTFLFRSGFGCYVINFRDVDNKKIIILGECHTQGLDGTMLTAEKEYSINFIVTRKKKLFKLALSWIK